MTKTETRIRQKIVDNMAEMVAKREADRKKRRLRSLDPVGEAVKQIAVMIALGKL